MENHFQKFPHQVIGVSEDSVADHVWLSRFRNHLLKRVAPVSAESFRASIEPIFMARSIANAHRGLSIELVIALAHGRLGLHAWRVARHLGVPCVTIFHDWWPEMLRSYHGSNDAYIRNVSRDFANAQRYSDLCLAVCPGMARLLKESNATTVLYPMPDKNVSQRTRSSTGEVLQVVYTGSLWSPYGKLITGLMQEAVGNSSFELRVYGNTSYLSKDAVQKFTHSGMLHPYIAVDAYHEAISNKADVLLAVMGANEKSSIRMTSSFPSKVANYFQTGNAVILWAPEESSLGQFCKDFNYPWWVPSQNARDVIWMLERLRSEPTELERARIDAARIRNDVFNPELLQRIFEDSLLSLCGRMRQTSSN